MRVRNLLKATAAGALLGTAPLAFAGAPSVGPTIPSSSEQTAGTGQQVLPSISCDIASQLAPDCQERADGSRATGFWLDGNYYSCADMQRFAFTCAAPQQPASPSEPGESQTNPSQPEQPSTPQLPSQPSQPELPAPPDAQPSNPSDSGGVTIPQLPSAGDQTPTPVPPPPSVR